MKHLLSFSLLLFTFSMCSTTKMASLSISKSIEIDGSNKDWPELTLFDKKSNLVYGVYNDNKFVYLFIKTADRMTQRKLLQGITVWYQPYFSKKKNLGIHYPFLPIRLSESLRREPDQEPDISILLRSLPREAELIDKDEDKTSILYLDEAKDEMNVAIGFSNETKEMTLIIEKNEMKRPNAGMRPDADIGGMQGGDGRSGGGMRRQGMRSRPVDGVNPNFDPISLRINIVLD